MAGRWSALGLSLALSADFAQLGAAASNSDSTHALLGWLAGGFALAGLLAAVRGVRERPRTSAAALVCLACWAGLWLPSAA